MQDILIALIVAAPVAFIIGKIVLALNGNDKRPWQHMDEQDTHRWR